MQQPDIFRLGDPHLGRRFFNGVPLAKQGMREARVWLEFEAMLRPPLPFLHVCMGDLFDKAQVSYTTLMRAGMMYRHAAQLNPTTTFLILKGNHDWEKDLERVAAFDVFEALVTDVPNIEIVSEWQMIGRRAFLAWHPVWSPEALVNQLPAGEVDEVYCHWDVDFGSHLIPTELLASKGIKTVYNGHVHKKRTFTENGVEVHLVGSMQPYAHGEETDESLYVTRTLAQLDDGEDFSDRCLRVVLQPGETWDRTVDCLQFTLKKIGEADDELPEVTLGDFDVPTLFAQAFAAVPAAITAQALEQYYLRRNGDAPNQDA